MVDWCYVLHLKKYEIVKTSSDRTFEHKWITNLHK
jgi:hypothetical protein